MRRSLRFWAVDIFTFVSQLILGIAAIVYGLISNHEIFIPIGLAFGCGGIGALRSLIAYTRKQRNAQPEMFDERADHISGKAASVAFKLTSVAVEVAFLISVLPYKMPYYVFPFTVGFIMFVSYTSYLVAREFYREKC